MPFDPSVFPDRLVVGILIVNSRFWDVDRIRVAFGYMEERGVRFISMNVTEFGQPFRSIRVVLCSEQVDLKFG